MHNLLKRQRGGSAIGTIIVLAVLAYGVFIAFQYIPQLIEARSIETILGNIRDGHKIDPVESAYDAKAKIVNMLQINEMNDMINSFTVEDRSNRIEIKFSYERSLNLLYKTQPVHYENIESLY